MLDDLCFKITDDERYKDVDEMMKVYKNNSKSLVNKVLRVFRVFLKEEGYECEVKGRYKNLYSINKKLRKKMKKSAIKLNDIFAFRIVLESNSVDECFEVLNLFHDRFYPVVDYFKDYVTIPKINGYQSLHTGLIEVVEKLDIPIEVQIRTRAMDDFAEKGFAAHWLYAKGKKSKMVTEKEKKLVEHFSDLSQGDEELKDVYVFTPKGDLFKLENGSTIVDFAYHLHSDLGHKARSAIVNGGKQDIYYRLMSGDCVEIKKSEKDCVKREWLDHVHSKHTRKKIYEKIGRQ
ncbi:bifunctional (p)ppGpp synthetase/guanosine-3',5'-bis(diphosphate) 3'-pyrophosphohydrolase [Candidatus Peregrinibacteria bacterium]|nr:bifunctional (p)ppGpp synthetase/guanosine-3',5'-bis(diphosphate) 3'-pyrophosphohydrolase [Candidatus Peregrinibacteria bacterium]